WNERHPLFESCFDFNPDWIILVAADPEHPAFFCAHPLRTDQDKHDVVFGHHGIRLMSVKTGSALVEHKISASSPKPEFLRALMSTRPSSASPIADAVVTFTPVGGFYELQISLDGNVISAVLSNAAVRAGREARQTKAATSGV